MLRLFPIAAFFVLIAPVAAGLAGVFLPAFGYLPVLGRSAVSLDAFADVMAMPGLGRSILLSLGSGLAATAISLLVVTLFVAGWRGTRVFAALERLVSPLLSVPHAAAAFGLAFLIAPSGFLFRLGAEATGLLERPPDLLIVNDRLGIAMTLGLIVKEIPFLLLMTLAALPQTRAGEMERMTASLGYGRIVGFVHGILPALYGQIRLAVLAVLVFSTSVVDVALILGPTTPAPLAVRILTWQQDADLAMHFTAAAAAVLQIGVTVLALVIWLIGERVFGFVCRVVALSGWRARGDLAMRRLAAFVMALSAAIVLAGLALLALWSVAGPWRFPDPLPAGFSLSTWMRMPGSIAAAFGHSLMLAGASAILAVVLALGSLEYRVRSARPGPGRALGVLYVPLLVPQIAFLFGLQILFSYLGFDGAFLAVLLVHLVFVFPYVLLSLSDPWWAWDPRYGHAVRALGRSPDIVFWRVRLPMLARPVLTAAALGFAVSIALYLPTLVIGAGRWPTVTTEAVALASGGDPRLIGATALLQALLPFLGFAIAALVAAFLSRNRRLMRAGA